MANLEKEPNKIPMYCVNCGWANFLERGVLGEAISKGQMLQCQKCKNNIFTESSTPHSITTNRDK